MLSQKAIEGTAELSIETEAASAQCFKARLGGAELERVRLLLVLQLEHMFGLISKSLLN